VVAGFHSFHWPGCTLDDADLNRALDELTEPTERDAYLAAFTTLLHSGTPLPKASLSTTCSTRAR
jgi:hypothetical protein